MHLFPDGNYVNFIAAASKAKCYQIDDNDEGNHKLCLSHISQTSHSGSKFIIFISLALLKMKLLPNRICNVAGKTAENTCVFCVAFAHYPGSDKWEKRWQVKCDRNPYLDFPIWLITLVLLLCEREKQKQDDEIFWCCRKCSHFVYGFPHYVPFSSDWHEISVSFNKCKVYVCP